MLSISPRSSSSSSAPRRAVGAFDLTDAEAPLVADICRRLDGIALAIEIAASRVDVFGVAGLAARLNDRFQLLMQGRRTALPRHRTLGATLDWSYSLLPESERLVLCRLAVFAGTFTMESASAILAGDENLLGGGRRRHRRPGRQVPGFGGRGGADRALSPPRHDPRLRARKARGERRTRSARTAARRALPGVARAGAGRLGKPAGDRMAGALSASHRQRESRAGLVVFAGRGSR